MTTGPAANSMLLDQTTWDLVIDASGNIALGQPPYATSQDIASRLKTSQGECWYDSTIGIPYWSLVLGLRPPLSLIKSQFVAAALAVPGVIAATCYLSSIVNRTVSGQVQASTSDGVILTAGI